MITPACVQYEWSDSMIHKLSKEYPKCGIPFIILIPDYVEQPVVPAGKRMVCMIQIKMYGLYPCTCGIFLLECGVGDSGPP